MSGRVWAALTVSERGQALSRSDGAETRQADLSRGRDAARAYRWADAFDAFSFADRMRSLDVDDLHLLATAAYLVGRVPESIAALRRAYLAHLRAGRLRQAARTAFWISYVLGNQGDVAQAGGWLSRAEQLMDGQPPGCAERGLLLGAMAFGRLAAGAVEEALDLARRAADIGRATGDPDALGLALTQYGGALVRLGRAGEAMTLFDEAMVAVVAAEISPMAAGTVYCSVVAMCGELAELRRAQEWTEALDAWCAKQQGMAVFAGQCVVHRAELLQLRGRWPEAVAEAEQACVRLTGTVDAFATGGARYQQAEIYRLSGDLDAAERAYHQAGEWGYELCPGLALLRLAQGDTETALAAMRRALGETTEPLRRARLLPAQVEITLAAGDGAAAAQAATELTEIAAQAATPALCAMAEYARAAEMLDRGESARALVELRSAVNRWRELDVPYETARTRVLIAVACRRMGDQETARLEFEAAARAFAALGAVADSARIVALSAEPSAPSHGLTPRELQVLRLIATGTTNRAIAAELMLSEKTVERHVSNVFVKLGVSSRSAATAYAFQHRLV